MTAPVSSGPLVVADIGGTNARFGWVERAGQGADHVLTLSTAEFAGPGEAMQHYLDQLPPVIRHGARAQGLRAGWALATAVEGDRIEMTNNHWRFSRRDEAQRLALRALRCSTTLKPWLVPCPTCARPSGAVGMPERQACRGPWR